ncbi:MAG TPA: aspartate dehydrogenase domain-containing protein [Sphingobium sp.]|nr:aspartate dehydrogenase domain-containing protein [Sphingobium sp.]
MTQARRKVAIVGYGRLGRYLADKIAKDPAVSSIMELAFLWNRSPEKFEGADVPGVPCLTGDVDQAFADYLERNPGGVDLIVEASHPDISKQSGALFLRHADYLITSVTALADRAVASGLIDAARASGRRIFVPTGAGWGVQDIVKMDRSGRLEGLSVTMEFHVDSLNLKGRLADAVAAYKADSGNREAVTLYEGSIGELAELAPNNVNTMTCLWLAAASLDPDAMTCRLIAQKEDDAHSQVIDVHGPNGFHVSTRRYNPARKGAVTGDETFNSFLMSLLSAHGAGAGLHFC